MSSTTAAEPLAGRSALVTGASRGIGRECARLFMECGARVVMLSRDMEAMSELIAEREGRSVAYPADLSNPDGLPPVLQKARDWIGGPPDIIVNNAGMFTISPIESTGVDDLKGALRVNLASPFLIVRVFLSDMKKRASGHVVTIGSIADHVAYPGNALYAATKFGARGFHEVLREETRHSGVRASLISPGPVDTGIWDPVDPDNTPGFTPRSRMLTPQAVAEVVLWTVTRPVDVNIDVLRLSHS